MTEEQYELSNDELDQIAGGIKVKTSVLRRAREVVRELKSKGVTREEALERYKDAPEYSLIRDFWDIAS